MIYLFYGEDDLSRDEYLTGLLARAADPMGDLNQSRLAGDRLTFDELRQACDALPFLSDRRILIVDGLLSRLVKRGPKSFTEALRDYLPRMPDYARLFLLEGTIDRRSAIWKLLNRESGAPQPKVFLKEFPLPPERALPEWLQQRARQHGGRMERDAARELAAFVGGNVRLLDQEVRKLVTYAGDRPVSGADVSLLVPYVQEASVWEVVDAIGARQARQALNAAQQILADDPGKAIYLHVMITRQIRLLLQVAELQRLGHNASQVQQTLKMSPFVHKKIARQSGNFTVERLEAAFDRLLESDVALKLGGDPRLTLDLLIVDLARRPAPAQPTP